MASKDQFNRLKVETFQKLNKDDYAKLKANPDKLKQAETEMEKTFNELKHMLANSKSFDGAVGHLSKERQDLIRGTFRLQSFKVDLQHHTDGTTRLNFASLKGKPLTFLPTTITLNAANYDENRTLLAARIVYEVFTLFLNLVGISIDPSEEAIKEAISLITNILNSDIAILSCIDSMAEAERKGDNWGVAKAILTCMVDLFSIAFNKSIAVIKVLLSDMAWYEIIITIGKVTLFVATLVATDGIAEIAEILAFVLDATSFLLKISQWNEHAKLSKFE